MEKTHAPSPEPMSVVCLFSPTVAVRVCAAPERHTLILTWRPWHDGHDRVGRVEFGGGQSRRRHFYFGSRRRRRQCGRATREIARVSCYRIGRLGGKGPVSPGRMWV